MELILVGVYRQCIDVATESKGNQKSEGGVDYDPCEELCKEIVC